MSTHTPNLARARNGYVTYDWANSGYVTLVVAALGGPYLDALAREGEPLRLLGHTLPASLVVPGTMILAVLSSLLLLPRLGRLADSGRAVIPALRTLLLAGSAAITVLALTSNWVVAALASTTASVMFSSSLVPYNALLGRIATREGADRLSGKAYAWGYLAGGILLAGVLAAFTLPGVEKGTVVQWAFLVAAGWWTLFGLKACRDLSGCDRGAVRSERTGGILTLLRDLPQLRRTALVGLVLNDAIGTVTALAALVLTHELWVEKGLPAESATPTLLLLILAVQLLAAPAAYLVGVLAERYGTKQVLTLVTVGWVLVLLGAYLGLQEISQVWYLAAGLATVQGGAQTLSRSLLVQVSPAERLGAVFSFTQMAERGTAWIGPSLFGAVLALSGSYRAALLSLAVAFVAALVLLLRTDVRAGAKEAASYDPQEVYQKRREALPDGQAATPVGRILYHLVVRTLALVLRCTLRVERIERLPAGKVIVVANHRSFLDGPLLAVTARRAGRRLHLMATAGLFTVPVLGNLMLSAGMVPVKRRTPQAGSALQGLAERLREGGAVGLYPEGRINRSEDGLPGELRTGAVRLALETGSPIVAVGFSDPAEAMPADGVRVRIGTRIRVRSAPPLDLCAELGHTPGEEITPQHLEEGRALLAATLRSSVEQAAGRARIPAQRRESTPTALQEVH